MERKPNLIAEETKYLREERRSHCLRTRAKLNASAARRLSENSFAYMAKKFVSKRFVYFHEFGSAIVCAYSGIVLSIKTATFEGAWL
jgi:hypothetical protein